MALFAVVTAVFLAGSSGLRAEGTSTTAFVPVPLTARGRGPAGGAVSRLLRPRQPCSSMAVAESAATTLPLAAFEESPWVLVAATLLGVATGFGMGYFTEEQGVQAERRGGNLPVWMSPQQEEDIAADFDIDVTEVSKKDPSRSSSPSTAKTSAEKKTPKEANVDGW
mmetsp:Transcript_35989/g.89735  ORF Transcript_35989/g.89735 Transcript_35989/m.89735 type:complete len:167 (+) Transcript_35989:922-1422(+)